MVKSTKILTVAYGTFSCTAEGFDDPLAVVRDTTDFFRGVVDEDRFFGAEPPKIDNEAARVLMHRKAQGSGGRDGAALPPGTVTASGWQTPAPAAPVEGPAPGPAVSASFAKTPAAPMAVLAQRVDSQPLAPAPLASVRSALALPSTPAEAPKAAPHPPAAPLPPKAAPHAEDDGAKQTEQTPAQTSAPTAAAMPKPAPGPAAKRSRPALAPRAGRALAQLTEDADRAAPKEPPVTAQAPSEKSEKQEPAAEAVTPEAAPPVAKPRVKLKVDSAEKTAPKAPAAKPEDDGIFAAWYDDRARDTDPEAPRPSVKITARAHAPTKPASPAAQPARNDAALAWDAVFASADDAKPLPKDAPDEAEVTATLVPDAPGEKPQVRVMKVRRAQLDSAMAKGQVIAEPPAAEAEQDQTAASPDVAAAAPTAPAPEFSDLSLEDEDEEDELARELAAVRAELEAEFDAAYAVAPARATPDAPLQLGTPIAGPQDEAPFDDEQGPAAARAVAAQQRRDSAARAMLTTGGVEEHHASRLMAQADSELEEPEGHRRRTSIAHLRAAVQATRADRLMGNAPATEDQAIAYRADLATVMAPAPGSAPQRLEPLQLVEEQRVGPQPQPLDDSATAADFARYAQSVGAEGLDDLLEAAAAFLVYVEGRKQFSRPQLMTVMRSAEATESSRDDRLRAFGTLLQAGKVEKTGGGRFTAAPGIRFRPDAERRTG